MLEFKSFIILQVLLVNVLLVDDELRQLLQTNFQYVNLQQLDQNRNK